LDYPDFAYRLLTGRLPKAANQGPDMPKGRITNRAVDALACPAGKDREFLWDDAIAGFGVAAFPSGKKVYVCQYRQGGRSRRANIGEHGRLTPDEARSEAKKLLGVVETGADPIEARRGARAVRTFGEVADDFLSLHVATKRKSRTGAEYRRILKTIVLPAIGSKRIIDVQRADVARLHGKLTARPTRPTACWRSCLRFGAGRRGAAKCCLPTIPPRQSSGIPNMGESGISRAPNWRGWARL